VFDFDGVILDTEEPRLVAWQEIWREHGLELNTEEWSGCIGTVGGFDPLSELQARLGDRVEGADLMRRKSTRADELISDLAPLPGVEELLAEASAGGVALAVASSSSRSWVEGHLERLGLARHFSHLACYDGTVPAKPAPDLYLAAVGALGVEPARTVAVEDSPNGVRAAKAAGLTCVAVPCSLTRDLDLDQADLVLASLATTSLADLGRLLAVRG
jgi:HAD superfamily hydrolase (TIGR01509 family)